VSAIIVSYNHERWVAEALDSAAANVTRADELFVIDDASTDGSASIIRSWIASHPDLNATFVGHAENVGPCATLNEAFAATRGKYIALLAGDDRWRLRRLATHVDAFETADDEVAVVYSDAGLMDEAGTPIETRFIDDHRRFGGPPPSGDLFGVLLEGNFIPGLAATIRRRDLAAIGPLDERLAYEDWDMWLRLAHHGTFTFVEAVLADYRIVAGSLIRTLGAREPTSNIELTRRWFGMRPEYDEVLRRQLGGWTRDLYRMGDPAWHRYSRERLKWDRRPSAVLLRLASALHLPYPVYESVRRPLHALGVRLRGRSLMR
jgi:glycosyltransferase involved in cell wall biosynthesis